MKILQFEGEYPNFGDALNSWLWPTLLPDFFDDDPRVTFIGVGSTIGDAPPEAHTNIVFGAGYVPHYHAAPDMTRARWDILFVRGPRTAARLGLSPALAIGDSGILARVLMANAPRTPRHISLMPHWESMMRGNWQAVCAAAGVQLIDPRRPVEEVMAALLSSRLVIAEAMHGAIIADALRVPWLPLVPLNTVHREKWYDWAEALDIVLEPKRLWPSSLTELSLAALRPASPPSLTEAVPAPVVSVAQPLSKTARAKRWLQATPLAPYVDKGLVALAARQLASLAHEEGQLSSDAAMERATSQMLEKLDLLKQRYAR